jgi:hypothetical protein
MYDLKMVVNYGKQRVVSSGLILYYSLCLESLVYTLGNYVRVVALHGQCYNRFQVLTSNLQLGYGLEFSL